MDETKAPILVHLAALRTCLIRSIIGLFVGMSICYIFVDHIMAILKKPMLEIMPKNASLVVLSPQEYFFTEFKAALFFGVILACPWIFFQIWQFVAPGLHKNEKRMLALFVVSGSICFLLGITFAYFLVFPPTFQFFLDTLPAGINGSYSIGMLYSFAIMILMAFGIVFQTPVVVFLLIVFGVVDIKTLAGYRKIIFVMSFVVGALLTPPDPLSQVLLAIPTYLLFELGLLLARLVVKKPTLEPGLNIAAEKQPTV